MINFVLGVWCGAISAFFVLSFIDLPFYRAAKRHWALSKKMLDEQQELFQALQVPGSNGVELDSSDPRVEEYMRKVDACLSRG
jgi:uncharacterized protein YggL (DUF469 family)